MSGAQGPSGARKAARAAALLTALATDDLTTLQHLLAAAHPAPHRTTPAPVLAAAFEAERDRLAALPTVGELDVALSFHRVLALLGDAHAVVALPMAQPGSTVPLQLLPILPRRVAGVWLIDASPLGLPPDTALLAIDGRPMDALADDLGTLVPADGRDPDAIHRALVHDWPRFHAERHGMHPTHQLRVRHADGTEVDLTVDAVDRSGLHALREARRVPAWSGTPTPDRLPALTWVDGAALLRVPTMGVLDVEGFRARVDALFAQVPPEATLLVDLRGNEGGLRTNNLAVLDPLLAVPYVEWTAMHAATRRVPTRFRDDLTWPWGSDVDRLDRSFRRDPHGGWTRLGDPLAHLPKPTGAHTGPVALLVDARTGSAANGLVLMAKQARPDVLVVGEPLGGACDRHIGELPFLWTAPHSGVMVSLSMLELTHTPVPGCVPGRGLAPDVRVEPTVADFVERTDPWVRAALGSLAGDAVKP